MGSLKASWKTLQSLFAYNESKTINVLVGLTDNFIDAQKRLAPAASLSNTDQTYSLYACSKDLGVATMHHMFLRMVDDQGNIICDIHGLKRGEKGKSPLEGIIEPTDFEFFGKFEPGESTLLWQGGAEEAGQKMRSALALVERVNKADHPYNLFAQSCNTLFHSLIKVMDLKVPKVSFWAPGLQESFDGDVSAVKQDMGSSPQSGAGWLEGFIGAVKENRATVVNALTAMRAQSQPQPVHA